MIGAARPIAQVFAIEEAFEGRLGRRLLAMDRGATRAESQDRQGDDYLVLHIGWVIKSTCAVRDNSRIRV